MFMPNRPGVQTLSRIRSGLLIREARSYAALTQSELAHLLGTTQSAVSNWERGADTPRVDTLGRILDACGFQADLVLRHRDDVDRAQVRGTMRLSPTERLEQVEQLSELVSTASRVPVDA
jgi:transcriptional regulator with XRE-family HTH domain